MTLFSYEDWLDYPDNWIKQQLGSLTCLTRLEIDITLANIIDGSNKAVFDVKQENCVNELIINNKAAAQNIILNFRDNQIKLTKNLKIIGQEASLTMIGSNNAYFNDITTDNIKEVTFISGIYKGLERGSNKLLHDRVNVGIWINDWNSPALVISSAKVTLAGEIKPYIQMIMKIYGIDNQNYNLDTENLKSLGTHTLKISDLSKSGAGISLFGDVLGFNSFIDGKNFVFGNNYFIAKRFIIAIQGTTDISGKISATEINILSNNLIIHGKGEIKSVGFEVNNILYPATNINLKVKANFTCKEHAGIFSNTLITLLVGENLNFNCNAEAIDDIYIGGNGANKEIGNAGIIISHSGNIVFNKDTKTPGTLIINGLVLAKQGYIKYFVGENFKTSGINAGALGININQIAPGKLNVEINQINDPVAEKWREILTSGEQIMANFVSFANKIIIDADKVTLNKGASILNLANLVEEFPNNGKVEITADSYIYHFGSNITANGNVEENANGNNNQGFGIICEGECHIESIWGASIIDAKQNIKLNGNITGYEGVFVYGLCLENDQDSTMHGLTNDIKINLKNCHFNNFGRIYSNSSLTITVEGGDFENHNILAGDDMKITVHNRKNFINYGRIYSNNNVRIALGIDAKILLKPGSLMYVGSYDFGHFNELVRLRIGEVECHGCTIQTIKPTTSIISASVLSVRITHYEKTDYYLVDQKTFLTHAWKERDTAFGIVYNVERYEIHATLKLVENSHNYHGPAQVSHTGDVILDVGTFSLIMSSFTGQGTAYFPNKVGTTLKITSEQSEKKVEASRGAITYRNTQDNVKDAFAIQHADVQHKSGNIVFTVPKDSINSVFAFREGIVGNFQQISLGSAKSVVGDSNSIVAAGNHIVSDITTGSISKGKTVIVYNWRVGSNELEVITPEYLQSFGFDISKLIHPRLLNSKIWGNLFDNEQQKIAPPPNPDELALQPIFFLKDDPFLAPFINEPLNILHFLSNLAFSQKGLVYTIGDGYFIAKLVDDAVFILLGLLSGVDNTKLLQTLAVNAAAERIQQGLVAGEPLTPNQIKALTSSIIWPVWRDNCLGSEKCLDFKLYFNDAALKHSLSGAVFASEGNIDIKVIGDVLIGLNGQVKSGEAIKFDLHGNFINLGIITSTSGTKVLAKNIGNAGKIDIEKGDLVLEAVYDIVNLGRTMVKEGNVYLTAGHDIKELILINPASPVPELTKRAIYAIGGSLYYEAGHDITQQATVIFASGDITMQAGNDIKIESIHQSRIVKEEYSRKHYLIQSTIDQYDAVIMVNGDIKMSAGHNFIGSGVKLSSTAGDANIKAGNEVILEDKTGYATNYQGATKSRLLGKSKVSVTWTTDRTANLEITAPGGTIYISSGVCTLEGGTIEGQKPIFKCDKLEIKPHIVTKKVETVTSESGLSPKVPLIDLANSDDKGQHIRDNTMIGSVNSLLNMQGPLDLLPGVNLISSIPGFQADYQMLKGDQAGFSPAALVAALLSKYISASISYGHKETRTSVTQTTSTLSQIKGDQCEFIGTDGKIAANINCEDSITMEFDNDLKLSGAKDTLQVTSEMESSSIDLGVSLSGVSFGVSFAEGSYSQDQVIHKPGTYYAKNIYIKVNNKLEIENAQINGSNVTVEALAIEINQVIDSSRSESQNSGMSMGITIGWSGTITPTGSISYGESLKQSQVVQFISGISGETVEVTANTLAYNIEAIKAEENLAIKAENLNYIAMPKVENIDTEMQVTASVSARSDGKANYFGSLYTRDGKEVISVGWSSAFIEGLNDIKEGIEQYFEHEASSGGVEGLTGPGGDDGPPDPDKRDEEISDRVTDELRKEFGDKVVDEGIAKAEKFKESLANLKEDEFTIENGEVVIELPTKNVKVANIGVAINDASLGGLYPAGTKIAFKIISAAEAKIFGKTALRIGLNFVKIHPLVGAVITAYQVGSYIYENREAIGKDIGEIGEFVDSHVNSIVESYDNLYKKKHNKENKGQKINLPDTYGSGTPPEPDDKDPKDSFVKKYRDKLTKDFLKDYEKFKLEDGSDRYKCEASESPLWKELDNFKKGFKTNGLKGNEKRYYRWDGRGEAGGGHKDIEVFNKNAEEIGSLDPVTGKMYRKGNFEVNRELWRIIK